MAAFLRLMGYALISIPPLLLLVHLVTQFPAPRDIAHTPVTCRRGSIQSCLGHTTRATSPAAVISSYRMDK